MKKILHLANWNSTNIGNGALIYGTQRVLAEDSPIHIEFVPESWDDYTFKRKRFDESFVNRVNETDALLVNGAVTFNAFRRRMTNTGMRFDLPLALWDKITKPIILYGLSYRCWPEQEYPNKDAIARTFEYILSHTNIFFGVRNDGTKEWIRNRFGFDSERIHEIPDPAVFVPYEQHAYPEFDEHRKSVLIAFNNEDAVYRFAGKADSAILRLGQHVVDPERLNRGMARTGLYRSRRHEIVKGIARAAEKIVKEREDIQFILVPHYLDDYDMLDDFINVIQERIAHQRIVSTGLLSVPHAPYFYGRYAQADLVLSMRVHSMSPSIGLNTPVIPITSQGRMRNFLKKVGLADIAVDIMDQSFSESLARQSLSLLQDSTALRERMKTAVAGMRAELREKNAMVFSLLAN